MARVKMEAKMAMTMQISTRPSGYVNEQRGRGMWLQGGVRTAVKWGRLTPCWKGVTAPQP